MNKLLVLDKQNTELEIENQRLIIRISTSKPVTLPLRMIETIVVATPVKISTNFLNRLASHNVAITFLSTHKSHHTCWVIPEHHGNHQRKLDQYALLSNPHNTLEMAKNFLRAKLLGQLRNTFRWQKAYPHASLVLTKAQKNIKAAIAKTKNAKNIPTLMGYEGSTARVYFQAISQMLAPSYGFTGRKRQPPTDPVNSCLSISYSLAQQETEAILSGFGLDAGLGFLHQPSYGRKSLACDFLEIIRPALDAWVLKLFATQTLTPEYFYYKNKACFLSKAGRENYFKCWANKRLVLKRYLLKLIGQAVSSNSTTAGKNND